MNTPINNPGTALHQALLRAIASYYADDPRILAVALFGSLARGSWDQYSDIDLDIVIGDDVEMDVPHELTQLCQFFRTIGERVALIIPDGHDAGDVVLQSLIELSIRYHPLRTTSPNIVDGLQILIGRIDRAAIAAAGLANRKIKNRTREQLLDRCVRYAVEVDAALQRRQIWAAVELLHRMRGLVMELFARAYKGVRPLYVFQADADAVLQARLGKTLPQADLASVRESLAQFLAILENDLGQLTRGQIELHDSHRRLIEQVRLRQTNLNLKEHL